MRRVTVRTGSRLHFGLTAFGDSSVRQFGGVGAMLHEPFHQLCVRSAPSLQLLGPGSERAGHFARAWWQSRGYAGEPPVCIDVQQTAPAHVGLGAGTQLALSVAAALAHWSDRHAPAELDPLTLATAVGRGRRSAVGTYGFCLGGLVVDAGKWPHETLGGLQSRCELPEHWQVVLVRRDSAEGPSGAAEQQQFDQLPPVPPSVTEQLWREVHDQMLPAAESRDCDAFGASLYRYGVMAGQCFAAGQGGPFATPRVAETIDRLRGWGIPGVGQSSWGPTVFAIVADMTRAAWLVERIRTWDTTAHVVRTCPLNRGAVITVEDDLCDGAAAPCVGEPH